MVQERLWRLDAAAIAPPKQALPGPAPSGPDLQETYLRFEREGLDDCRGFANQHDFELRVYVQQLS
ncbi:hypothetical protein T492DRAFT_893695 [Pavlovales sp. CCMP2436]|nr:hypothetical protein T492DRAFT_893695 [Pavlovales sp. CCMP2436]